MQKSNAKENFQKKKKKFKKKMKKFPYVSFVHMYVNKKGTKCKSRLYRRNKKRGGEEEKENIQNHTNTYFEMNISNSFVLVTQRSSGFDF